jgi:hypothetical protein
MPPVDHERLPASLLERFAGDCAERLIALLRFLSPLTERRPRSRSAASP